MTAMDQGCKLSGMCQNAGTAHNDLVQFPSRDILFEVFLWLAWTACCIFSHFNLPIIGSVCCMFSHFDFHITVLFSDKTTVRHYGSVFQA